MNLRTPRLVALLLVLALVPLWPSATTADPDDTDTADASAWSPAVSSPSGAAVWGAAASTTTMVASTIGVGAFYSNDNGRSWSPAATDVVEGMVAFDPSDPDRGYLAGFGGMDRTTDGGATWTKVIVPSPAQRVAVADDGTVAAAVRVDWDSQLYVSMDSGDTWTVHESPVPGFTTVKGVAFGDTSEDIVMMTTSDTWVSADGGVTWTETGGGGRDMVRTDDGAFWVTGFSGMHRSTDGGHTWTQVTMPGGLPHILAARAGGGLYGASGNGIILTLDDGATWIDVGYGEIAFAATALFADPEDPDALIMGDENMGVNRIFPTADGYGFEGRSSGFPPVQVAAFGGSADGSVLLAGGGLGLYASRDGGTTWSHTGAGIGYPSMQAVGANVDGSVLFAGGRSWILSPYLMASRDGGQTWDGFLASVNDGSVAAFAAHPTDPDVAWAALWIDLAESHLLETRDRGVTWNKVFTSVAHVADVAYHTPTGTLLVATDAGVMARPDGAAEFAPLSVTPTGARFVDTAGHIIVAEGQGTSVWRNQAGLPILAPWADTGDVLSTLAVAPSGTAWAGAPSGALYRCDADVPLECEDDSPPVGVRVAWVEPSGAQVWAGTEADGLFVAELPA